MDFPHAKVSAFVISYNRAGTIGTCLRALRFADELIVVDKSSTDATPQIAARIADRVITVPWTPTADETRAFAAAQCAHDWLLFLDDDECLSPAAVRFIQAELAAPRADAYALPLRHYILGEHDERAYYWPEHHIRLARRDAVEFSPTIHACIVPRTDRVLRVDPDSGVCIHHLSHQDVAQWLEKTNRYTSCPDRAPLEHAGIDLAAFAHARIDHWLARSHDATPGGYPQAVALLRATYDMIDRLKLWEEQRGVDGAAQFAAVCATLDAAYGEQVPARDAHDRLGAPGPMASDGASSPGPNATAPEIADATGDPLRARLAALHRQHAAAAAQWEAERTRLAAELASINAVQAVADRVVEAEAAARAAERRAAAAEQALAAIQASRIWRATAWPRRAVDRLRRRG